MTSECPHISSFYVADIVTLSCSKVALDGETARRGDEDIDRASLFHGWALPNQ